MAERAEQLPKPEEATAEELGGSKPAEEKEKGEEVAIECAVCLQTCVYPVQLPCKHIFCFLCVKGVTLQSKRCAMCRREIPPDYLHNPELLSELGVGSGAEAHGFEDGGQWFYEGRNGWWLYDERTSQEIETAFSAEEQRCELLIAGFLYIIDFEHMLQYRRNDPSRRRRIKRDQASGPKKGVAGLRMEGAGGEEAAPAAAGSSGSSPAAGPSAASPPAATSGPVALVGTGDAADDDGLVDRMAVLGLAQGDGGDGGGDGESD
jgi:E3 ubiquitin-protein ligase RNF146